MNRLESSGDTGHNQGVIPARPAWRRPWPPALTVAMLAATALIATSHQGSPGRSLHVQVVCLAAAVLWVVILGRKGLASVARGGIRSLVPHHAWLLVLPALVLRAVALTHLPPSEQTGFEELETGSNAYSILGTRDCAIEFRFTNLLAAAGLLLREDSSLASLRLPFQVAGCISIVLIVLCLRALKVGWLPTLLTAYTAATLRWLVIGGGVADELFAGIPVVAALLWLVAKAGESRSNAPAWAGAAGICAGTLMYEYTSYRVAIVLGVAWLVWLAVFPRRVTANGERSSAWAAPLCLLVALALVAMPTILEILRDPAHSTFAEAFLRHGRERTGLLPTGTFSYIQQYARALLGLPSTASLFFTPTGEPVIPLLVGCLFALGLVAGMVTPGHGIARALAVTVIVTVVSAAATANNAHVGRMSPVLPMLLVMTGISLASIQQWALRVWERMARGRLIDSPPSHPISLPTETMPHTTALEVTPPDTDRPTLADVRRGAPTLGRPGRSASTYVMIAVYAVLAWQITSINLEATRRMSRDPAVLLEWANDDYAICHHVGLVANPGQRVYVHSPDGHWCCPSDPLKGWLYPGLHLEVHPIPGYELNRETYVRGDLVVAGARGRSLTPDEMAKLLLLARETDSVDSLRTYTNVAGRMCVASICIQCE